MSPPPPPLHHVVCLALPNVVAFDLSTPAQVFGHPAERKRYAFTVCGARPGRVETSTGFALAVDAGLEALARADTVVVPGHWDADREYAPDVLAALRGAHERGARIVSICTGAFALAAAGLLDGLRATTHWYDAPAFARRFPDVVLDADVLYVDQGQVLTSAGVAAGIDLCLHLVRADHGAERANKVARRLVVPPHRDGGQAQYVDRPLPAAGTTGLEATRAWALQRLDQPLTVADLARHAHVSERTLMRRFRAETGTTPLRWLHDRRVAEARRLLERTTLPIEDVAARCGFGSAVSLRDHFRRATRTTPTAYRRAFAA